jgi:hypothetical protein
MIGTILLNYNENVRQVEEEEKSRFLKGFLEQCFEDAPELAEQIASIWEVDGPLPAPQKIKLRSILTAHDIQVIDEQDGTLIIYIENQKVATFKKPTYKLKQDLSKLNRKERVYIEMTIECESLFETAQEV